MPSGLLCSSWLPPILRLAVRGCQMGNTGSGAAAPSQDALPDQRTSFPPPLWVKPGLQQPHGAEKRHLGMIETLGPNPNDPGDLLGQPRLSSVFSPHPTLQPGAGGFLALKALLGV